MKEGDEATKSEGKGEINIERVETKDEEGMIEDKVLGTIDNRKQEESKEATKSERKGECNIERVETKDEEGMNGDEVEGQIENMIHEG